MSVEQAKQLRNETGHGIYQCRLALLSSNGCYDCAKLWLAYTGLAVVRRPDRGPERCAAHAPQPEAKAEPDYTCPECGKDARDQCRHGAWAAVAFANARIAELTRERDDGEAEAALDKAERHVALLRSLAKRMFAIKPVAAVPMHTADLGVVADSASRGIGECLATVRHALRAATVGVAFADLRHANLTRLPEFGHGCDEWSETDWATAMAGECGEACNLIKKRRRGEDIDSADVGRELADIVIYADLLAARMRLDLGEWVRRKFDEVSERRGLATRLRAAKAREAGAPGAARHRPTFGIADDGEIGGDCRITMDGVRVGPPVPRGVVGAVETWLAEAWPKVAQATPAPTEETP